MPASIGWHIPIILCRKNKKLTLLGESFYTGQVDSGFKKIAATLVSFSIRAGL